MCARRLLILAVAMAAVSVGSPAWASTIEYDLAADWSDVQNPNGPWLPSKGAQFDVGLIMSDASTLDAEATAVKDFLQRQGLTTTQIDSSRIAADPQVLQRCDMYWAAASAVPSACNDATLISALKDEIEGQNKGLFTSGFGTYVIEYLGYGSTFQYSPWSPSVDTWLYWVDARDEASFFGEMTRWVPPSSPDVPSQLFWYAPASPGKRTYTGEIGLNWSIPLEAYHFAYLYTQYGSISLLFDPALQAEYGITGSGSRAVEIWEIKLGRPDGGGRLLRWRSVSGANGGVNGPMGERLLAGLVTYLRDHVPPSAPVLTVHGVAGGCVVEWQDPTDVDFKETCIYRSATQDITGVQAVQCGVAGVYLENVFDGYYYRARSFDIHGNASEWSNEVIGLWPTDVPGAAITQLRLYSNQPNPFNPRTTIRFDLPVAGQAQLSIYDLAGRLVRVLVEGEIPAGSHEAVWDGRDASGRSAPSGSYLARLVAGGKVEGVRLSLVR